MSPTYHLLVGIPGKSNAFVISKNLGLPEIIIDKAKSMMSKEQIDFEELLKNIFDQKSKIEKEKDEITKKLENISNLEKELTNDNKNLKLEQENIINKAKQEARNILLDAKEEANDIIKNLSKVSDTKTAENLRNKLNKKINSINNFGNIESKNILDDSINNSNTLKNNLNLLDIKDIKPGTSAFIKSFNDNGTILSYPSKSNEVQVQIGIIKTNIPINELEKPHNNNNSSKNMDKTNKKNLGSTYSNLAKAKTISSEINVIGLNIEEATFVVDKFLDDCSLSKLDTVRIVHGKGTGKLMKGIHKFLKTNPHVKSFRSGTYGEGEMGVTIVELK